MSTEVPAEAPQALKAWMSSKTYDGLKFIAQIVLPALGTLYFAVAVIWKLPYGEQVVGTVVAVDAFLGAVLGLASRAYNKSDASSDGVVQINTSTDEDGVQQTTYRLVLDLTPEELAAKDQVILKSVNARHADTSQYI